MTYEFRRSVGSAVIWRTTEAEPDPIVGAPRPAWTVRTGGRGRARVAGQQPSAGTTPVESDLTASYSVVGTVSKDLAASYTVVAAISKDLAASYAVQVAVTQDLAASYSVTGTVTKDFTASYDLLADSTVTKDFTGAYTITGSVESDLDSSYSVREAVSKDLTASYTVVAAVQKDLTASYSIQAAGTGATADEIATAVWAKIGEDGMPYGDLVRVLLAALSGRTEGIGTLNERYLSADGSKTRIDATFDSNNNRVAVTLDGTP